MAEALTAANALDWGKWTDRFLTTRDAFTKNFQQLLLKKDLVYSQHPELRAEYDKRVAEGLKHRDTLSMLDGVYKIVQPALQAAGTFAEGAFKASPFGLAYDAGFNLVTMAKKALGFGEVYYDENGNQLGFVQGLLVPIGLAAAAAAIVTIAYFVTDNMKYVERLNTIETLQAKGYTPEQATAVVDNQKRIEAATSIGAMVPWLAAAAALVVLGPSLIRMMEKGGSNA